jgi:hypothetical protein
MGRLTMICGACLFLMAARVSIASAQSSPFSVHLKGNLTTTSQLFPRPYASDPTDRASFFPLEDILGYSVELRLLIPETNIAVGFSTDYIRTTTSRVQAVPPVSVPIEDGYRVIPVELTGYFILPLSGDEFGVYMGGGGGAYFGRRIYRVANVQAPSEDTGTGYGIHVLGGVSYKLLPWLSLTAEMKFRDLQFETTNRFSVPQIAYRNVIVNVGSEPFVSRIHTDGIMLQIGAALSF